MGLFGVFGLALLALDYPAVDVWFAVACVVRSCRSASTRLPCGDIAPPWCVSAFLLALLALDYPAVDTWFAVAVRRVSVCVSAGSRLLCGGIGLRWRVSFVPAVLLALDCPAVILVRRGVCLCSC